MYYYFYYISNRSTLAIVVQSLVKSLIADKSTINVFTRDLYTYSKYEYKFVSMRFIKIIMVSDQEISGNQIV